MSTWVSSYVVKLNHIFEGEDEPTPYYITLLLLSLANFTLAGLKDIGVKSLKFSFHVFKVPASRVLLCVLNNFVA